MINQHNKSLYWYGVFANLKKSLGVWFVFMGILLLFFVWVFGIILIIIGFILIAKGNSQRFDYQRQSGHIIHRGD